MGASRKEKASQRVMEKGHGKGKGGGMAMGMSRSGAEEAT